MSFCSLPLAAQIPGVIHYGEEDGLNTFYTYRLSQDKNGFIWIGSDNGLFRFDGKEFKQYKEGLKNMDVLDCKPISNNELFIISFLSDFAYLKNDRIINSDINKELKKIQLCYNPISVHIKGGFYMCNKSNPKNIYLYKDEKIQILPLDITQGKTATEAIGFDVNAHLLYTRNDKNQIEAYNMVRKTITICDIPLTNSDFIFKKDNFFIRKSEKKIEIYKIENKYHFAKINTYYTKEDIDQISIDKNNKLWLSLDKGGVLYFDQPLSATKKPLSPILLLEDYIINNILVDVDNNVWFSTRNNGIFFVTRSFFNNYINLTLKNNSSFITAITDNGKNIILGYNQSKGGVLHSNTITDITLQENKKTEHKAIFAKGNMVIFGITKAIFKYDLASKKKKSLNNYSLKNIVPYNDSSVLLCASSGLIIFDFIKDKYSHYLSDERIYSALPYSRDSIFAGNFKDLYKINLKTRSKKMFLEGYYFKDIKELKPNLYIAATNPNGILVFNRNKIVQKITEKDGLLSDQIKKISIENENIFWASTNFGISRIEFKNGKLLINNFTQTDGLPSNVIAGCVIRKDTIYIATSKGLSILSIHQLLSQQKSIHKKVIVNSVSIGDKKYFNVNRKLVGRYPDNEVTFHLSFPDYSSQGKISYKYLISGLNNSWQISNSSSIILNAVPPGKYVLRVFGLGYNGRQSATSSDIAFEIEPQFWQTWWFRLLLIVTGILILLWLWSLYLQKRRNKKLENLYYEKKIAELELQAIKAQINPHFIYNCLNSIQFLLYKKNYPETENYLDIFSQMIRKTLYYSEKALIPIKEEIEYLTLYLSMEKLRLKEQFNYAITISDAVDKNWIIPSLLIQPFVENAIKHGVSNLKDRKGKITISFDYKYPFLVMTITDNGVGIDAKLHTTKSSDSFGVKLSKKRIETFRQIFEIDIKLEIEDLGKKQKTPGTLINLYMIPHENKNTNQHH
ncbi:histidine kinase [Chryseobacterium sp. Tr-659]|uniref:sensor histidine kinase n=1 Tax=Chryseobacterium sp. Tr-659 TaxID=2608340 RepID=UPI00141FDFED|nr:histidine kinase [Chryseobacterium sp. Tr-659]